MPTVALRVGQEQVHRISGIPLGEQSHLLTRLHRPDVPLARPPIQQGHLLPIPGTSGDGNRISTHSSASSHEMIN